MKNSPASATETPSPMAWWLWKNVGAPSLLALAMGSVNTGIVHDQQKAYRDKTEAVAGARQLLFVAEKLSPEESHKLLSRPAELTTLANWQRECELASSRGGGLQPAPVLAGNIDPAAYRQCLHTRAYTPLTPAPSMSLPRAAFNGMVGGYMLSGLLAMGWVMGSRLRQRWNEKQPPRI